MMLRDTVLQNAPRLLAAVIAAALYMALRAQPEWLLNSPLCIVWYFLWVLCLAQAAFSLSRLKGAIYDASVWMRAGSLDVTALLGQLLNLSQLTRRAGLAHMLSLRANWRPLEDAAQLIAAAASPSQIEARYQDAVKRNEGRFSNSVRTGFEFAILLCVSAVLLQPLPDLPGLRWLNGLSALSCVVVFYVALRGGVVLETERRALRLCYRAAAAILEDNSVTQVYKALCPLLARHQRRRFEALYQQAIRQERALSYV